MKIASYNIENYIKNIANTKVIGALVFGPERSVVSHNFSTIAKKIVSDLSDPFLVVNLSKERFALEPTCLADEFFSFSMLGGRKLIIIKEVDAAISSAFKALMQEKDLIQKSENFILIEAGDLEKSNAVRKLAEESSIFAALACYEDDEKTLRKYIEQEVQKNNLIVDNECFDYLCENLGKNRQIIALQIEKVALYLDGSDATPDLIGRAINKEETITINHLIDSFAQNNLNQALKEAEYLLAHDYEVITIIRFLSNYIQKLYHAKIKIDIDNISFEEAIKMQRLFFKAEAQFRKHLKENQLATLVLWLLELQNLETKIKSGFNANPKLLLAIFLQNFLKNK